jgi:hypothetical protein
MWRKLVDLAKSKLVCQPDANEWANQWSPKKMEIRNPYMLPVEAASLLGTRVLIYIKPQSGIAEKLVSEFMTYCFHIDNDRETLIVQNISEPILAHASGEILGTHFGLINDSPLLIETLRTVAKLFRDGAANGGYIGEF